MILFVDDEKQPEWFDLKNVIHATSFEDAQAALRTYDIDTVYLDNTLYGSRTKGAYLINDMLKVKKVYCISLDMGAPNLMKKMCDEKGIEFEDIGNATMLKRFSL